MTRRLSDALEGSSPIPARRVVGVPSLGEQPLIGRAKDKQRIAEMLTGPKGGTKLFVCGLPGVGKSAVVLETVYDLIVTGLWSSVIWIDLRTGASGHIKHPRPTRRTLADVTRDIAVAVDDGRALRASLDDRLSFLTTSLSGESILIIADNVDDDSESDHEVVRFLRQSPRSVSVIFTSVGEPLVANATQYKIDPLGPDDSANLFQQISGLQAVPPTLVRKMGGVPARIRLAAVYTKAGLDVEDVISELGFGEGSLAHFAHAKDWLRISRSPSLRRTAALICGPFAEPNLSEAQSILGRLQTNVVTNRAIIELRSRQLLEIAGDTIAVDDLVRGYLESRISATKTVREVASAYGDWTTSMVAWAGTAINYEDVFERIDGVRSHCFSLIELLESEITQISPEQHPKMDNFAYYLYCRGYWDELLRLSAVTHISTSNRAPLDDLMWVELNWILKIVRLRLGVEAAERTLGETREYALRRMGGKLTLRHTAIFEVAAASLRDRLVDGRELAERLEAHASTLFEAGDVRWAAVALLRSGNVWRESRDLSHAERVFQRLEAKLMSVDDGPWRTEMIAICQTSLGIIANSRDLPLVALSIMQGRVNEVAQLSERAVLWAELAWANQATGDASAYEAAAAEVQRISKHLGLGAQVSESHPHWKLGEASS